MATWRVAVYYSGYTTVHIEADEEDEAIIKGRQEAAHRLGQTIILDPGGCMAQLIQALEPWEACDTAEKAR